MPKISIVTPCYNEEGNISPLSQRVAAVFEKLPGYTYEHIFADNASTDRTVAELKALAASDPRVKVIINMRNFGAERSIFNAILAARGDAVVVLAADMQDPPEMIADFISEWEQGVKIVFGIRAKRKESFFMTMLRKIYYRLLRAMSDTRLMVDAGDFVLFDRDVAKVLHQIKDNVPYLRGILSSLGFSIRGVPYKMEKRTHGQTSNNLYRLFVYAFNGFISNTLTPLRLATLIGLGMSGVSLLIAFVQMVWKLLYWDSAPPGIPTVIIGMFGLFGIQFFLIGYLGEIIGAIYVQNRGIPRVIEQERINFEVEDHGGQG